MKLDTNRLRAALAQEKTAIHCDTPEKEKALNVAVGRNIIEHSYFGDSLCVTKGKNHWGASHKGVYERRGYTILPLDDFILPDRPRLAEILGVEVGQEFCNAHPDYRGNEYRVTEDGALEWRSQGAKSWNNASSVKSLIAIINNPRLIRLIRIIPRWTDDDIEDAKAVRRLFPDMMWVARDKNARNVWVYENKPVRKHVFVSAGGLGKILTDAAFPSVTWDNSPVKLEDIV